MKTLAILFLAFLIIPNAIAQNPTLLTDAFEGPESSFPANLCSMNDLAIFTARNNDNNYELWKTDGTSSGTSMLLEINADTLLGSMPEGFVYFNGNYFFTANDGHHGFELWKTDGTAEGTSMVIDLLAGEYSSYPGELTVYNNTLFFRAYTEAYGSELWKTSGEASTTELVADMAEGSISFFPQYFFAGESGLYFSRSNNQGVYYSDGTADGTIALSTSVIVGQLDEPYFEQFGNDIYFRGKDRIGINGAGTQLWRIQGYEVERVTEIYSKTVDLNPTNLKTSGDLLYFFGEEYPFGRELWAFDGQAAYMVRDIAQGTESGVISTYLTAFEDQVFFAGYTSTTGLELWTSDGTVNGTQLVQDICPGAAGSFPISLSIVNEHLFFSADNGLGEQIWKLAHASMPAVMFSNALDAVANSSELKIINGLYVFKGSSENCGTELWVLNEAASAEHFKSLPLNEIKIWPNPADEYVEIEFPQQAGKSYEFSLQDINGQLLFRANFRDQRVFPLQSLELNPGEYLIQIQNHEFSETRRIIIK